MFVKNRTVCFNSYFHRSREVMFTTTYRRSHKVIQRLKC